MSDSQLEASAAALRQLGYDVPAEIAVGTIDDQGAAAGLLQQGDVLLSVDGAPASNVDAVRSAVQKAAGAPVTVAYQRDGADATVQITPQQTTVNGQQQYLLGVGLMQSFDLPVDVKIQLNDVGGPSAGMMFALGIIDKMSPGDLTEASTSPAPARSTPTATWARSAASVRSSTARSMPEPPTSWPRVELQRGRGARARRHPRLLDLDARPVDDGARDDPRQRRSRRACDVVWFGIVAFTANPENPAPRMKR